MPLDSDRSLRSSCFLGMVQALATVSQSLPVQLRATTTVVEGSTIVGFTYGLIFVAYAGIPELLPNKYRYV
jgi:hypothetical protein